MQPVESKKYPMRQGRTSLVNLDESEVRALHKFFSKCKNEPIKYGKTTILWKDGVPVHLFFEDSVPIKVVSVHSEATSNPPNKNS